MNKIFKSTLLRSFLCLAIVATMMLGVSTTAHAKIIGTQTWDKNSDVSDPTLMRNNNMSPNKTMGFSGDLYIWAKFVQADVGNPEKVDMIVYNRTQGTHTAVTIHSFDAQSGVNVGMHVNKGDVLQVYFDISTEDGYSGNGHYRAATITYGYSRTFGTWFN